LTARGDAVNDQGARLQKESHCRIRFANGRDGEGNDVIGRIRHQRYNAPWFQQSIQKFPYLSIALAEQDLFGETGREPASKVAPELVGTV